MRAFFIGGPSTRRSSNFLVVRLSVAPSLTPKPITIVMLPSAAPSAPSPRKIRLCQFLRNAANSFIAETEAQGGTPAARRESAQLRTEFDSLLTLVETGQIDAVELFRATPLPEDPANDPADAALVG
jgi:hypothetical protein